MSTSTSIVRNLSDEDFQGLLKTYKNQPKKKALLKAFRASQSDMEDLYERAKSYGYEANKGAFLTLKHRLLSEIVAYKKANLSNEIVQTENRIHALRMILYSKDQIILEKEIDELKALVQKHEIIQGRYEIHFCDYLLNYNDKTKRTHLSRSMELALKEESLFKLAEFEFYRVIFEYQDLYYSHNIIAEKDLDSSALVKIKDIHEQLKLNVTEFFYLSVLLTLELKIGKPREELLRLERHINRLNQIYHENELHQRFPHCDFAILCLTNKYQLATGASADFARSKGDLSRKVEQIIGLKTYEDVFIYYLYASLVQYFNEQRPLAFIEEVEIFVNIKQPKKFSERFLFYYYHFLGLAYFGMGNIKKAESSFRKSRNNEKQLDNLNLWIQIEHYLALLVIQIQQQNYESFIYEFGKIKQLIKKREISEKSILDTLDYFKSHADHSIHNSAAFVNTKETQSVLSVLTKKTNLLFLLRINHKKKSL